MNTPADTPPMPEEPRCPQCGAPLVPGTLSGLCAACLLRQGATEDTMTGGGPGRNFEPPSIEEISALFPQLEILELIGKGGMGAVYKARQKELDRIVALKILPRVMSEAPGFADRFAREAKALAKLNHPGIVTIHEFGRAGTLFFIVMEFVDGVNLRQLLARGRVSPREALAIVPEICDALQFAHDHGIVHRDIKPANVLIDRRGRVKVADFGLAKLIEEGAEAAATEKGAAPDPSLTEAGKVLGTPSYMAPEQKLRPEEVDHRADIYALGVVFYELLTGELPATQLQPPSRKVQIDVRLDEIVMRALEREPALRYQHAKHVKTAVETVSSATAENPTAGAGDALPPEIVARDSVPHVRDLLRRGWELVRDDFWPLIGITALIVLLESLLGSAGQMIGGRNDHQSPQGVGIFYLLLSGPLVGGLQLYFLRKIRGESATVETAFSGFRERFLHLLLAGLVTTTLTTIGYFCLIIPGIYLTIAWMFTLALVIDKKLHFWSAMELSRRVVTKHWWRFFGFALVLTLLKFAGLLVFIVGFFIALPIATAALMFLYEETFSSASGPVAATAAAPMGSVPRRWVWAGAGLGAVIIALILLFGSRSHHRRLQSPVRELAFGTVSERIVTGGLDLENGTLVDFPLAQPLSERDPARYAWLGQGAPSFAWMRERGVDLIDAGNHGLMRVDAVLVALSSTDWQSLSADRLREKLRAAAAASDDFGNMRVDTYGFETREGSAGLLQIIDTKLDRGVKIRYKIAKVPGNATTATAGWLLGQWAFDADYFKKQAQAAAEAATDETQKAILHAVSTATFDAAEGMNWTITTTHMQSNHPQTGARKGTYRIIKMRDPHTAEIEVMDQGKAKRMLFRQEGEHLVLSNVTSHEKSDPLDLPAYYRRVGPAQLER